MLRSLMVCLDRREGEGYCVIFPLFRSFMIHLDGGEWRGSIEIRRLLCNLSLVLGVLWYV